MTETAWLAIYRYGIVLDDFRARQMARKLRSVEDMPADQARELLSLSATKVALDQDEDADADESTPA